MCDQTLPPRNVLGVAKHPAQRASQDAGSLKYMATIHFVSARRAASWPFVAHSFLASESDMLTLFSFPLASRRDIRFLVVNLYLFGCGFAALWHQEYCQN